MSKLSIFYNSLKYFIIINKRNMTLDTLSALRIKYKEKKEVLLEENINVKEPITLFKEWMESALKTEEILEPNAACLATVNSKGCPSNRFVLLKDVSSDGFTFFTNYGSRKANDIATNPNVAMTLYWCPLRRSVRIEGKAEKIPVADSLKYFHQRPRASQIGALASEQSTRIPSRHHLDVAEQKLKDDLGDDKEVPMPNWGGYLIRPQLIEFWQGQVDRLHDRIVFRRGSDVDKEIDGTLVHKGENGWIYERLAP
uniref:pyridoxal 5'-phosphate synthase n=2 Tax=Glossina morsitans morsitans TaxID=37546 RepID=A0A1B0FMS3_GLOMM